MKKRARSPLAYPGGKTTVCAELCDMMDSLDWTEFREPFCGGACVSLEMMRRHPQRTFWLNDKDINVFAFWHTLREQPDWFCAEVRELWEGPGIEKLRDPQCYLDRHGRSLDRLELPVRALDTYIKGRLAWAGGATSGPHQSLRRKAGEKHAEDLKEWATLLRSRAVRITNFDWFDVAAAADPRTMLFADPPFEGDKFNHLYDHDQAGFDFRDLFGGLALSAAHSLTTVICREEHYSGFSYYRNQMEVKYGLARLDGRPMPVNLETLLSTFPLRDDVLLIQLRPNFRASRTG